MGWLSLARYGTTLRIDAIGGAPFPTFPLQTTITAQPMTNPTINDFLNETAEELTAVHAAIVKAIDLATSGCGLPSEKSAAFDELYHRGQVVEDIIASLRQPIADLQDNSA